MEIKRLHIRHEFLVMLFLVLLTSVVYFQVKDHDFINLDDADYVTGNPHVKAGLTLESVKWAFTSYYDYNWHPLTWLSHMLDVQLFKLNPGWHHLTNLFFHIANTLLLFLVLHRMTKAIWQCAFVAAVFALHPLHVESVAWVAERKDVLSTFFWLLTMGAYVFYVEKPEMKRYLLALLFFALGLMAKPMLVTLPFVLLLLDYWPLDRYQKRTIAQTAGVAAPKAMSPVKVKQRRKSKTWHHGAEEKKPAEKSIDFLNLWTLIRPMVWEKVPFFCLTTASSIVTYVAQQSAMSSFQALPLISRIANAFVSYFMYIAKMIWPNTLAVFYPHPGIWSYWQVFGAAAMLTAITFAVIWNAKRFPYLIVGWLWYAGTLVPVIGIIQVGIQAMADRYTYVPLIGLLLMIAWAVPDILKEWRYSNLFLAIAAGVILSALMILTWIQVNYWRNPIILFEHTLRVTGNNNIMAHNGLGGALLSQKRIEEAIAHYRESLRINPRDGKVHNLLGAALREQGKLEEAVAHYREALRINPRNGEAHSNLAIALQDQGLIEEAVEHYRTAISLGYDPRDVYFNLGCLLASQGRFDEAASNFKEGLRIDPGDAEAYFKLADVLASQNKYQEAMDNYSRALRINPDYAEAHFNAGSILAGQGKLDEAITHFRDAVRLKPDYAKAYNNLGNALLVQGKVDEAVGNFQQALHLKPDYTLARENLRVAIILQKKSR